MKVRVDSSGCISCGVCVDICPEMFQLTAEGLAEAYGTVDTVLVSKVQEAAEDCPTDVIAVEN